MQLQIRPKFILVVLLVAANFLWGFFYFTQRKELADFRVKTERRETNARVVEFSKLFINDVLKAEGEVDFEKRLTLENAVRALKDPEIFAQWGRFVGSKSEASAQAEVKNLLGLLIDKIEVK